jgi:hypothetical protein
MLNVLDVQAAAAAHEAAALKVALAAAQQQCQQLKPALDAAESAHKATQVSMLQRCSKCELTA